MQGRIADGTLFPQISAKIQETIDKLVKKTFHDLRHTVKAVLALIASDVEMALASRSQRVDSTRNQADPQEERRKADLMADIRELDERHKELLASISGI